MLFDWVGDLLSPPRCPACSEAIARSRRAFCVPCWSSVERCEPSPDPIAFAEYGGALARAIQRFKYEDSPDLARPLGALVRQACRQCRLQADVIVAVPLHARRLASRGYNPAALLARHVAREIRAPLAIEALQRVVDTIPQVELPREARRSNVVGAFRVPRAARIEGRTVALVDDVTTTGATLRACRDALFEGGATRVIGVVLARTMPS